MVAPGAFAGASNTITLLAAPQLGLVAPELFHGLNATAGTRPTAQSRNSNVAVDTSGRQNCVGKSNREDKFVDTRGREKVSQDKNSQATHDESLGR